MKIYFLNRDGVPPAEAQIHAEIEAHFSKYEFSKDWMGFASFALPDRQFGGIDFDLVLFTHRDIICVELKNWHGKELTSTGGHWLVDGKDRGNSPLVRTNNNKKKLATFLKAKGDFHIPILDAAVVLHGEIAKLNISANEKKRVLTQKEFFSIHDEKVYERLFDNGNTRNITADFDKYLKFFYDGNVRERVQRFDEYERESGNLYEHKDGLFQEFLAKKPNSKNRALIRYWNFDKHPSLHEDEARKGVALREKNLFEYVEQKNPALCQNLLRPITEGDISHIGLDYSEILVLRENSARLPEFIHKKIKNLSFEERLDFSEVIINKAAQFHQEQISHHNLESRNIWINDGAEVQLTGFAQSHFPGNHEKNFAGINTFAYPEEELYSWDSQNDFQRDIYALGCIVFELLFEEKVNKNLSQYLSSNNVPEEYKKKLNEFFRCALNPEPSLRYQTATEMLNAFLDLRHKAEQKSIYSDDDFKSFYNKIINIRDYDEEKLLVDSENLRRFQGTDQQYRRVIVSEWALPARVNRLNEGEQAILHNFLRRITLIQNSQIEGISKFLDFGFDKQQRNLITVEECFDADSSLQNLPTSYWTMDKFKKFGFNFLNLIKKFWLVGYAINGISKKNVFLVDGQPWIQVSNDFYINSDTLNRTSCGQASDIQNTAEILYEIACLCDKTEESAKICFSLKSILDSGSYISLDPLVKVFEPSIPKSIQNQKFIPNIGELYLEGNSWYISNIEDFEPLENGTYLFKTTPNKREPDSCSVYIIGKYKGKAKQLVFTAYGNGTISSAITIDVNEQTKKDAVEIQGKIFLCDDEFCVNAQEVFEENDFLKGYIKAGIKATNAGDWSAKRYLDSTLNLNKGYIPTNQLWKEILKAEEDCIPEYIVQSVTQDENTDSKSWMLQLNNDFDITREDDEDNVFVECKVNDFWRKFGNVDREAATQGKTLFVKGATSRIALFPGMTIRIRTRFEKSSYDRRRNALDEMLNGNCRIPDFYQYFDKNKKMDPVYFKNDLNEINILDKNHFNDAQKEAFETVISSGPISLLQGPPGTGKTRFISALMLHLMKENPNVRILLTSQSNEAVNNAIEKMIEQCKREEFDLNVVRIGDINKVSPAVQWYHAKNQESRYREKFRVEKVERILKVADSLGLPEGFSKDIINVYTALWNMSNRLQVSLKNEDPEATRLELQFYSLIDRLFNINLPEETIASDNPSAAIDYCVKHFKSMHNIDNDYAVQKLTNLIELTLEFEKHIGTIDSKFSEFLTKTKTIVAGTLVGLGGRALGLKENTFDWVIIDEASRATASELAIVCQVGRHVLLVGDHKQLPPSYSSDLRDQLSKNLNIKGNINPYLISDFERIFESPYGKQVAKSLLIQYRMDPVIGQMVSSCFYENKLQTGRKSRTQEFVELLPARLRHSPVVWYDTSANKQYGKETAPKGKSIYNLDEANAIVNLLLEFFANPAFIREMCKPNLTEPPIGVICMYSGQKDQILNKVRQNHKLFPYLEWIKVDTVDSYQGKENRIIILSTVRQNNTNTTGFLKADSRVNVAVSRAKDCLVIFGSVHLWKSLPNMSLGKVLGYLENNDIYPIDFSKLLK